ncbi:MAG: hypothetical protein NXH78_01375 [Hyphomonadaceae bacterium]|nr:hypothetical protein [Hyphomonadaceae bacterium]
MACQSVEDTAERLACFEAAAQQLSTALAIPQPQIVQAPTAASATGAVTAPVQQATTSTTTTATAPIQQAATETAEPPSNGSILPSWLPRVSFGTQRDVEQEPDEFETRLTRIQRNKLGRHFFTTAEGHVWRQIRVEDVIAPSTLPSNVILRKNWTGSIKLKIVETDRTYTVMRVE